MSHGGDVTFKRSPKTLLATVVTDFFFLHHVTYEML